MGDFPKMTDSGTLLSTVQSVLSFLSWCVHQVFITLLIRTRPVRICSRQLLSLTEALGLNMKWILTTWFMSESIKNRKIPLTTFLRSLGIGTNEEIEEVFGPDERLTQTIMQKDQTANREEALLEVYKKLRPGEPPTVDSAVTHLNNLFLTLRDMIFQDLADISTTRSLALVQDFQATDFQDLL